MPDKYHVDEIDCTFLRFDPNHHKFYEDICEDMPSFKEYDDGLTIQMRIRVFAWIVVMYDMNTQLRREIKDLYKRKVYAGNITGLTPHKVSGKYAEWVEKIFTGQNKVVNDLIVKYIVSFSSPEYTQLMAHIAMQETVLYKIIAGNATKDNQLMFDSSTKIITGLTRGLYGSGERDEIVEARRALYKQVALDLSDMRPESVARTMQIDGELPEGWSPYGDYLPNEIKFVSDQEEDADE